MSLLNEVQLFPQFQSNMTIDLVSGHVASVVGDEATIVPGMYGNGLQMSRTSHLCFDTPLNITTQFSVGFWLTSNNPGMVKNPNTGAMESVRMPLLAKSGFTYNPVSGSTTTTNAQFVIYEQTLEDGTNVMSILLQGSTAATITTAPYDTGVPNHFWIIYDGNSQTVTIYKGVDMFAFTTAGVIPSSLNFTASNFTINKGVSGQIYNILNNTGVIDDLVIMNVAETSDLFVNRLITLGGPFALDTSNCHTEELCQAVMFDDNTTIRINAVYSNDANLYVARSDGKLLKDNRDIWQTTRNFSDTQEVEIIGGLSQSGVSVANGILNINGTVIRV